MERAETIKLFALFKIAYPRFYISQDKTETKLQIDLWTELFSDIPYAAVEAAAKKHILSSVHPPTIAEIHGEAVKIMCPPQAAVDCIRAAGYLTPAEIFAEQERRYKADRIALGLDAP